MKTQTDPTPFFASASTDSGGSSSYATQTLVRSAPAQNRPNQGANPHTEISRSQAISTSSPKAWALVHPFPFVINFMGQL
ncbi:hypothetical protein V6N11_025343 [Hibiscus sabdariffa]|uniref:Uncharacterized protein n=2 Tax=Hibiscus sabdariffa TaxID=183260 RepID=A0ABR2G704_9ROSI